MLGGKHEEIVMGQAKEAAIVADEDWESLAEAKGWVCSVCSSVPPKSERDIFFNTGICGWCAHTASKDD